MGMYTVWWKIGLNTIVSANEYFVYMYYTRMYLYIQNIQHICTWTVHNQGYSIYVVGFCGYIERQLKST